MPETTSGQNQSENDNVYTQISASNDNANIENPKKDTSKTMEENPVVGQSAQQEKREDDVEPASKLPKIDTTAPSEGEIGGNVDTPSTRSGRGKKIQVT